MAEMMLFGFFDDAPPASEAVTRLRDFGIPENKMSVMSSVPYRAEILGRRPHRSWLTAIALLGGLGGAVGAILLLMATFGLYPIHSGGQPIYPIPPSLIVVFEITMLGTMYTAFGAFLALNRFPALAKQSYSIRISEGQIGLLAQVDEAYAGDVERIMRGAGALDVEEDLARDTGYLGKLIKVGLAAGAVLSVVGVILLLFAYGVLTIPIPTNMADQESVAREMGPRLQAPASSIPIQGATLVRDQPGTAPIPTSPQSVARGAFLFSQNCALCHGPAGAGDGPIGAYFAAVVRPANLTAAPVQSLTDAHIYRVITQGFGAMPSLAENLTNGETWDVVNFVRTLRK